MDGVETVPTDLHYGTIVHEAGASVECPLDGSETEYTVEVEIEDPLGLTIETASLSGLLEDIGPAIQEDISAIVLEAVDGSVNGDVTVTTTASHGDVNTVVEVP